MELLYHNLLNKILLNIIIYLQKAFHLLFIYYYFLVILNFLYLHNHKNYLTSPLIIILNFPPNKLIYHPK